MVENNIFLDIMGFRVQGLFSGEDETPVLVI